MRKRYPKPVREIILELLREAGGLTSRELAEKGGINFNTVRGRLQDLRREGLVRREGRTWVVA